MKTLPDAHFSAVTRGRARLNLIFRVVGNESLEWERQSELRKSVRAERPRRRSGVRPSWLSQADALTVGRYTGKSRVPWHILQKLLVQDRHHSIEISSQLQT